MTAVDVLANANSATVTTGGTTAPSAGTVEEWVVVEAAAFPAIGTGETEQFRVIDKNDLGKTSGYEIMLVTARTSSTSWTVTRGAELTGGAVAPYAHAPSWIAVPAPSAAGLVNTFDAFGAAAAAQAAAEAASDPLGTAAADVAVETSRAETAENKRILWRGAWAATTAYAVNDGIIEAGGLYVCNTAHTSGSSFVGTDWTQVGDALGAAAAAQAAAEAASDPAGSAASALITAAGLYLRCDVVAPSASGDVTGATDYTNLAAAIASVPVGGKLGILNGLYYIDAPLQLPQRITVEGESLVEEWYSATAGMLCQNTPGLGSGGIVVPTGLPFKGVVITQVTANDDVVQGPVSASTHHLKNICVTWATLNTSTGHGFNFTPSTTYGGLPDYGSYGSTYENCISWGHDGNHYGFTWMNCLYATYTHLRSYGGGGYRWQANSATVASGNSVVIHPYCYVTASGSADGFHFDVDGSFDGALDQMTFIRPQANAGSIENTQCGWNDFGGGTYYPTHFSLVEPDIENFHINNFGPGTNVSGDGYISATSPGALGRYGTPYSNTVIGAGALGAATTSPDNAAFGNNALAAQTTNGQSVGIGFQAGQANTAAGLTAIGYAAGAGNTSGTGNVFIGWSAGWANAAAADNTAVGYSALLVSTASNNTAVGAYSGIALTSGGANVLMGTQAAAAATTADGLVAIGYQAGYAPLGTVGNATVAGAHSVFIGMWSGVASASDFGDSVAIGFEATINGNYATAVGRSASAGASGAVAIGVDSSGNSATTTTANAFVLGTSNHTVNVPGTFTAHGAANFTGIGAFVASDKYLVISAAGAVHVSALGPAS